MKKDKIRNIVLVAFLLLFTFFSLRHFIVGGELAASVDALCPFGGFETFFTFITTGGLVPRILLSSLILAIGIILTTIVLRRGFCGYICPFGTVQEFLGKITKKKIKVPKKADKYGRYLKYIILIAILVGTAYTSTLVFRNFDPFVTFFHFGKGIFWDYNAEEFASHLTPFIITIFVLISAVFIERAWCKYLCPLGATMAIFSEFGLAKIKRDKNTCIDCKACDRVCPVDVKVSTVDKLEYMECINCNQCITKCPKNSLSVSIFNKKMTITKYIVSLILLFFLAVALSKATGVWQSLPGTSLEGVGGELNPDNIKGWMTLKQVSDEAKIHIPHFIENLDLPIEVDVNIPLKDIGKTYGFDFHTEAVREYVRNFEHREEEIDCPYGITEDETPGQCGLYKDQDENEICDYSE